MLGDLIKAEDMAVLRTMNRAYFFFVSVDCETGENLFAEIESAYMALFNEWLNADAPGA